jgi:hypothetical protein
MVGESREFGKRPFPYTGVMVLISRVFGENKAKGVGGMGIPQSLGRHGESGLCACSCSGFLVSGRE